MAVVGIELMPQALAAARPWAILLAFVAGSGFAILVDRALGLVTARTSGGVGAAGEGSGPWAIYFGVAVDLFSDGVIIGTGSTIVFGLGLLLALGQVPADIPEGFKLGLLAFTAGIPLTVAIEEMVTEAHEGEEPRLASIFLVGGFALFALLSV
ncbi:MAG TPA: hypothetical protein VGR16_09190, partial [Thermomicrobiales bacterium]|nr:hypothetical protein [Thermomicrobiales bacterium]